MNYSQAKAVLFDVFALAAVAAAVICLSKATGFVSIPVGGSINDWAMTGLACAAAKIAG